MTFHIFRRKGRWTVTQEASGLSHEWITLPVVVASGLASKRKAQALAKALGGRSAVIRMETV